jgi:hypothetical protein
MTTSSYSNRVRGDEGAGVFIIDRLAKQAAIKRAQHPGMGGAYGAYPAWGLGGPGVRA